MTPTTRPTTVAGVRLYELWSDERAARKTRLAVAALIVAAIGIGATVPEDATSRLAFAAGLAVALAAWVAWALLRAGDVATVIELALIGIGGTTMVAVSGRSAVAALAFPLIAVAAAAERLPIRLAILVAATAAVSLLLGALV